MFREIPESLQDNARAGRMPVTVGRVFVIIGFFLVLILLVTNGVIGGGLCVRGVGCLYSNGDGLRLDNSKNATISVE